MTATKPRKLEYVPLDDVAAALRNPKAHAPDRVTASIRRWGFAESVVEDERTGRLVAGHGRVEALTAMREAGDDPPDGIVVRDGAWTVPVTKGWASRSDEDAHALGVALNRTTEVGGWADRELAELLEEFADSDPDLLAATGFSQDDLDHLIMGFDKDAATTEVDGADATTVNPRHLPIDAIFTIDPHHTGAFIAHEAGLKIGTQSSVKSAIKNRDRWEWRFPLTFIDNEWHDYDHDAHVAYVAEFHPKYATVRDVMTKAQCAEAGVAYYTLDQVLEMGREMQAHADNVMIIPKYDCIADIPDDFMLGYSVRSSYGATPVPAEKFKGRRVHLLGGSWADQRRYLNLLGESVVSLDFNHCFNASRWGGITMGDGSNRKLVQDYDLNPSNGGLVSLAISLGNIGRAIHEITSGESGAPAADLDLPPSDPDHKETGDH